MNQQDLKKYRNMFIKDIIQGCMLWPNHSVKDLVDKSSSFVQSFSQEEKDMFLATSCFVLAYDNVKYWLRLGANPNAFVSKDGSKSSIFMSMSIWGSRNSIYDPNKICDLLLRHGADMNHQDFMGQTALFICLANENYCMARCLVEKGCLHTATSLGDTPLAYLQREKPNHTEMISFLKEKYNLE
jgi:ankyrin repeat protein